MRSIQLAFLLCVSAVPGAALAKAWQGISPGITSQAEVLTRFGEPSTHGRLGGRVALVYKDYQAISGTKQAQFFLQDDGKVAEITVFPATQLDKDAIEGTYGKSMQKTFTDDFKSVWVYRGSGVMVFFTKDGGVEAITFKPGEATARPPQPPPGKESGAPPAPSGSASK